MSQQDIARYYLAWEATAVGEYSLAIIALAIIWVVFLVSLRRWNASLRLPYLWLKYAIPFLFLSVTLSDIVVIISLVDATSNDGFPYLDEAASHMSDIGAFFASIADIFVLLCLVEMALSFLRFLGKDSPNYKIIRYSNFCIMGVLFVLDVAALGKDESNVTSEGDDPDWTTVYKLYGAESILYWILSLGLLFLSIFVLYSSTRKKQQQNLTSRFLATAILNFIRATWEFAIAVRYDVNFDPYTSIPEYVTVVDPILYTWATLLIFGILISIFKISA